MGRSEPPFLYDPPANNAFQPAWMGNFNPRAATEASWAPPLSRPERNEPLINFNRHPDSVSVYHLLINLDEWIGEATRC